MRLMAERHRRPGTRPTAATMNTWTEIVRDITDLKVGDRVIIEVPEVVVTTRIGTVTETVAQACTVTTDAGTKIRLTNTAGKGYCIANDSRKGAGPAVIVRRTTT